MTGSASTSPPECLDWLLVVGRGHLERTLEVYIAHYNAHRPTGRCNLSRRIQPLL
jgi:hypothetical protein